MGKRNIFYDDNGKEIACYIQNSGELHIEIKDENDTVLSIELSKEDALLFILDLYRMKKHL
jgi:hypothetical protein